jgi:hypothetical protein
MNKPQTIYQMLLVKPYQKEGERKYSYTNIGIAFRKDESDIIDMKLDLFPILIPGAFIQLKPVAKSKNTNSSEITKKKNAKSKK